MERFAPRNLAEVEEIVRAALSTGTRLGVQGMGGKQGFGRPREVDAVVGLAGLSGISLYEPEDLVMVCGAGTPLAEVEAALAERRQQLAFEPPDAALWYGGEPGTGTIGGTFACNLAGPRRFKAGAARDHLLGVHCVTGRGETVKTGGRVVKNVTGYDLCKLLSGSFGTLAVLGQLSFKVLPAPERCATLLIEGADLDDLAARLRKASGTAFEISGASSLTVATARRSGIEALKDAGTHLAALRVEGFPASVADRMEGLVREVVAGTAGHRRLDHDQSLAFWREIRDLSLLPMSPVLWRLSVAPSEGINVAQRLHSLGAELLLDQVGDHVWAAMPADDAPRVRALVARGGHATLIRAPDAVRRSVQPFQPQEPGLAALARRVRNSFDPERILERGRMVDDA